MSILDEKWQNLSSDDLHAMVGVERETERIDFKRELPSSDSRGRLEFLKDVTALANTHGGFLLFGIDEEAGLCKEILGSTGNADEEHIRLVQWARSCVQPSLLDIQYKVIDISDQAWVLALRVGANQQRVYSVREESTLHTYVRRGAANQPLSEEKVLNLVMTREPYRDLIRWRCDRIRDLRQSINSGKLDDALLVLHFIAPNRLSPPKLDNSKRLFVVAGSVPLGRGFLRFRWE
ncbi:MAG: ATP-binding protein [Chloroflexi bacterium]|nr:ATP-binding protein [Chloroflexota bacterium]